MKAYQIINENENGSERRVVYETTRKREVESFFGKLMRGFKKDGNIIIKHNIGYCDVVSAYSISSYFITLA